MHSGSDSTFVGDGVATGLGAGVAVAVTTAGVDTGVGIDVGVDFGVAVGVVVDVGTGVGDTGDESDADELDCLDIRNHIIKAPSTAAPITIAITTGKLSRG